MVKYCKQLKEHALMQYRSVIGHAPANFAFVTVLTSSIASLAFSKYWRAQIAPITDRYCIYRFSNGLFIVFHWSGFLYVPRAQIALFSDLHCMKVGFIIFIFAYYSKLKRYNKMKKDEGHGSLIFFWESYGWCGL